MSETKAAAEVHNSNASVVSASIGASTCAVHAYRRMCVFLIKAWLTDDETRCRKEVFCDAR